MEDEKTPIYVIGAGLTGCMTALMLARRNKNQKYVVIDHRKDFRADGITYNTRIHLADNQKEAKGGVAGDSVKDHQAIYSISRTVINHFLLDAAEECKNVEFQFLTKLQKVDKEGNIYLTSETEKDKEAKKIKPKYVIGADGGHSQVRKSLLRNSAIDYQQQYRGEYKEICVSPVHGEHRWKKNYLHIWPRGFIMFIALPNPDGTFTGTIFAPLGKLAEYTTKSEVEQFFTEYFPSIPQYIPDYVEQFLSNPTSPLCQVNVKPWHNEHSVILGDAAHALVPFYGQGMNCGFEDAQHLDRFLAQEKDHVEAFKAFSTLRPPASDALALLSYRNFREMADLTDRQWFKYKKQFENYLHRIAPSMWIPIYTMVSFTSIPYNKALDRADLQDKILMYTIVFLLLLVARMIFF